ncbi:MAG: 1,4-dihydroxy-6-naphthoate synthase [Chitinophagaceae bacterium]
MKLTLGFSPCPNDTFIFDALVNKKIPTGGIDFEVVLEDVQTLNEWAIQGRLDTTKISYGVLPKILNRYIALNAGGALGKGVGPLLVSKTALKNEDIQDKIIAIPGMDTTAHLLFSLAFPAAQKKQFLRFSEIENAVLQGRAEAGVIIHENRFTFQDRGLVKLMDLGEYWEKETKSPVPLGGIVIRRTLSSEVQQQVDDSISNSVKYAFNHYPVITDYVKMHSQEMNERVMRQHIDLYVNDFSVSLNTDGKAAVFNLLKVYEQVNQVQLTEDHLFV